jgi:hypothetical protein
MSQKNYRIEDLEISGIGHDPENFDSEVGIESQGDEVVVTYIKHRGLRHTDDGSVMFIRSHFP